MDRRDLSLLVLLAAIWGSSYLWIALALRDLPPATVTVARLALGALLVGAVAWRRGVLGSLRGRLLAVTGLGTVQMGAPFLLIAQGQQAVTSSLAGTLVATTPVWAATLAAVLRTERQTGLQWVGIVTALVGVALLLGLDAGAPGTRGAVGALLVVLAALCYAVAAAWARRSFAGVPSLALVAGSLAGSTVVALPLVALDPPTGPPSPLTAGALAVLGLVGTGAAFVLLYRLFATVGPVRTLLLTYLAPVFAVAYGAVLLREPVGPVTAVGFVLVLAGAWLAGRRGSARTAAAAPTGAPPSRSARA